MTIECPSHLHITFIIFWLRFIASTAQLVTTYAGGGPTGNVDATGTSASFGGTTGGNLACVAFDIFTSSGNIFVTDLAGTTAGGFVRMVTPGRLVSTLAGNAANYASIDGIGTGASFYGPSGLAVSIYDGVIVAEASRIRSVMLTGVTSTISGGALSSHQDGCGTSALFTFPTGIATSNFMGYERVYFITDSSRIRMMVYDNPTSTFCVSTVAGSAAGNAVDGAA